MKLNFLRLSLLSMLVMLCGGTALARTAIFSSAYMTGQASGTLGSTTNNNVWYGDGTNLAAGNIIQITGNLGKGLSKQGKIKIGENTYDAFKNSKGAQTTITLPTGCLAYSVDFYVTANATADAELSEFEDKTCSDAVTSHQNGDAPTIISKTLAKPANTFTFNFKTNQVLFVAVVHYLEATDKPEFTTNLPAEQTVKQNVATTLSVTAIGATSYQWYKASSTTANPASDEAITGATTASYEYTATTADTEYIYCAATNANGTVVSNVCALGQRKFVDFKIIFQTNPYTVTLPTSGELPTGVVINAGTYNGSQHGVQNPTITVPVDGPVLFTLGSCQYGNHTFTVKDANDNVLETIDNNNGNNNANQQTKFVTYRYNKEEAATLTFSTTNAYLPFFYAEACDYVPSCEITYYDVDGTTELKKETIAGGSALTYNEEATAAVTVGTGKAFRGWFNDKTLDAQKVAEGTIISQDTKLYAKATDIETVAVGKVFSYDLTKTYFYAEDHEAFINNGGSFNDGQHGWSWGNTKSFSIPVAGNAQIVLGLCQHSANAAISVTAANETNVEDIASGKGASDGATTTVNYSGEATTLTFTFAGTTYIHNIKVYNVESFPTKDEATGYYMVGAGDGAGLILALNSANAEATNASSIAKIFLPNGTYDVGSEISQSNPALAISKSYVSIIGESMDGVIIKGVTPAENESLKAGLLHNTAEYTYLQDLTIQNYASAYNKTTGAERANAMRDEGNYSMLKNVYLKGTQDAYLTNGAEGQKIYYEGGQIEGTVDFICGSGNVFFKEVNLYAAHSATYKAATGKEAGVYIAAPNTYASEKGYVFNGCTISGEADLAGKYFFARPWNNAAEKKPACTWINTKMELASEGTGYSKEISSAIYPQLRFHELNTTDANGGAVTTHNLSACTLATAKDDLYLTAETGYTINEVLGDFATSATQATTQLEAPNATYDNGSVTWTPANNGATAYLIEKNGKFVGITSENSYAIEIDAAKDKLTIRAANSRGGFGEAKQVAGTATGIHAINAAIERGEQVIYNIAGQRVNKATRGLYIVNGKKIIVK